MLQLQRIASDKKLFVHEFATAFPVLRHVHAKITVLIVLVLRKVVKMMTIVMTILMMMFYCDSTFGC